MFKTVIKELIIFMLLLLSLALLVIVVFYEYIPRNKIIPSPVAPYTLSAEVEEELESALVSGENIIKTYSIDSSDLRFYEDINSYTKGKVNPFEAYAQTTNENTTSNQNTGSNNNTGLNNNTTSGGNDTTTPGKSDTGSFWEEPK